ERRAERQLLADYEATLGEIAATLTPSRMASATALAAWPAVVKGYGPVREANMVRAREDKAALDDAYREAEGPLPLAAE
ncbi:MAG: DUF6537 domain-containing protein, partial [Pseudomonadota bacterium]